MSAPVREVRNELQQARRLAVDDEWLDDLRLRIDDLCAITSEYLEPDQVEQLREACYFAADAHAGIYRKSGEPYIFHPLAVARILANVRFDHETLQGRCCTMSSRTPITARNTSATGSGRKSPIWSMGSAS